MVDDDYQLTTTDTVFLPFGFPAGNCFVHNFPEATQNRWQMFSLPMQPINESDRAISEFSRISVRKATIIGASIALILQDLVSIIESRSARCDGRLHGQFGTGQCVLIYLRNDAQGSVASTSPDFPESRVLPTEPYNYVTLQPGWNQVGNPFTAGKLEPGLGRFERFAGGFTYRITGWLARQNPWAGPQIQQDFAMAPFNGYAIFNRRAQ